MTTEIQNDSKPQRLGNDIPTLFAQGAAHHQAGRLAEAGQFYTTVLTLDPAHPDALHMLGVIAFQSGQVSDAIARYRQVLRLRPDHPFALHNLAAALKAEGHLSEAVECYQQALRLKPDYFLAHYNLGLTLQTLGKVGEAITHYLQACKLKPDDSTLPPLLGGALKTQGKLIEAAGYYQHALRLAPNQPQVLNDLGLVFQELGQLEEAIRHYQQALRLNPNFVEARNNLGITLQSQGKFVEAIQQFTQAVQIKPDYAPALANMGNALREQGQLEQAIACYQAALRLQPTHVEILRNLGSAWMDLGQPETAIRHYEQALALKPDYPEAHWNESEARLRLGDFETGWQKYEWRWRRKKAHPHGHPHPLWDGSCLKGRTLLIHCEQGLGDSLQFIRYIDMVKNKGGRIVVHCQKELLRLFRSVAGIDLLVVERDEIPRCDYQIPLLSLPLLFETTLNTIPATIPYLHAEADLVASWRTRLTPAPGLRKVGLVWAGNPQFIADRFRSPGLRVLLPLFDVKDVVFYALQKGEGYRDLQTLSEVPANLIDLAPQIQDFADTAAIMVNLDLIISSCTSPLHLAGGLGCPAWGILPFTSDWRWLMNRDDSPWYPGLRLFRQPKLLDWTPVVHRVVTELSRIVPLSATEKCKPSGLLR